MAYRAAASVVRAGKDQILSEKKSAIPKIEAAFEASVTVYDKDRYRKLIDFLKAYTPE
jgi:hypothetical protein